MVSVCVWSGDENRWHGDGYQARKWINAPQQSLCLEMNNVVVTRGHDTSPGSALLTDHLAALLPPDTLYLLSLVQVVLSQQSLFQSRDVCVNRKLFVNFLSSHTTPDL